MKLITSATSNTKTFPRIFPGRTGKRRGIFNLNNRRRGEWIEERF